MERVLVNIPHSHVVYQDDLLVHGSDFDRALSNLSEVFAAIWPGCGLTLQSVSCWQGRPCSWATWSAIGIATNPAKVAAVRAWPTPSNVRELRSFIKGFATIASPLHHLTDKGQPFSWGDTCTAAFFQLKEALKKAPLLAYPEAQRPFIVDTDVSNVGVGAVLSQQDEDGERMAYFSHALGRAERNYCVT